MEITVRRKYRFKNLKLLSPVQVGLLPIRALYKTSEVPTVKSVGASSLALRSPTP